MSIVEWLLCGLLFCFVGLCIYTDCKQSVVPNIIVVCAFFSFFLLDVICYCYFAQGFFRVFLINLVLISAVSLVFNIYHIWAAGDCKLMLACAFGIPGRLYSVWPVGQATSFIIFIVIFSAAFLYLVFESTALRIKNKQFKISFKKINLPRLVLSYFSTLFTLLCVEGVLGLFVSEGSNDLILSIAINFVLVLSLIQIRDKMSTAQLAIMLVGTLLAFCALSLLGIIHTSFSVSVKNILLVLALMFLSTFSEEFNYISIPIDDLKAGQILSAATVLLFSQSRIEGLPKTSTEDLRSRLTQDNVDSIKKWSRTKRGLQSVIIVRKIPFVVFMGIGLFAFIVTGVLFVYDYL